jgi:hypothetical protein
VGCHQLAGQFHAGTAGCHASEARLGLLRHGDQAESLQGRTLFGLTAKALIPIQAQSHRFGCSCGRGGRGGAIQRVPGQGQSEIAAVALARSGGGGRRRMAQGVQVEAGRFTEAHQDQGAGSGIQLLEADAFTTLGVETPLLQALQQGGAETGGQLLPQGLAGCCGRLERKQAHRQGVAIPAA